LRVELLVRQNIKAENRIQEEELRIEFRISYRVLRMAFGASLAKKTATLTAIMQKKRDLQRFLCKTNPIYGINWSLFVANLKKQSQFAKV
jgi:EamA domain-containing membrane protein RarD